MYSMNELKVTQMFFVFFNRKVLLFIQMNLEEYIIDCY